MSPAEALKVAREGGLDLVEVSPTASPPVCRIINYGKYLYQLSKRQHEARKHQKSVELKEVKMRTRTSGHDFEVKRNRIVEFLQEGSKVKATIMFRGREMVHRDIGYKMMERLIQEIGEVGQVENRPRFEGPNLSALLAPKKTQGKGAAPKAQSGGHATEAPVGAKPARRPSEGAAKAAAVPEPSEASGG